MRIHSTNPDTILALQRICQIVLENGGNIHADIQIYHEAERLWIGCLAENLQNPLIVIPDELFIPVTHLAWSGEDGILAYSGDTSALSQIQLNLLDAMVNLYNATEKIQNVAHRLPSQLASNDPELVVWLQHTRPSFEIASLTPAEQFIRTRLNTPSVNDGTESVSYLMPIIDMLNHHPDAPKYQRTYNNAWLIPIWHKNSEHNECFIRYNKLDSLSIAFWHGYSETDTQHLASVDCQLQHHSLGRIKIIGTNTGNRRISAPRIFPMEEILTFQDLVLDSNKLHSLKIFLGLAVRSKRRDLAQPEAEVIADEIIQLLVEANIRKYAELQELCRMDMEDFPLRALFGQVAEHQLSLLRGLRTT